MYRPTGEGFDIPLQANLTKEHGGAAKQCGSCDVMTRRFSWRKPLFALLEHPELILKFEARALDDREPGQISNTKNNDDKGAWYDA